MEMIDDEYIDELGNIECKRVPVIKEDVFEQLCTDIESDYEYNSYSNIS
jgi:hypothetical protein